MCVFELGADQIQMCARLLCDLCLRLSTLPSAVERRHCRGWLLEAVPTRVDVCCCSTAGLSVVVQCGTGKIQ